MKPPDRLPDLSTFLSVASPDVPGGIVRRVSEAFGGQVALLLLDVDGLYVHPTAIYPEPEERPKLLGVSVPLMELEEHTLSRAIFDRQTLAMPGEDWTGEVPLDGEHIAAAPVRMADEAVGVLLVASDEPFAAESLEAMEYVAVQAGAALGIAERYSDSVWRSRRRISPSLAAQVQHDLLPPQEKYTDRLSIVGRIDPAYDMGGDWYDYAMTDGGMFAAIADVSGKGLAAEHLASTTLGAVRKARRDREGLPEIAKAAHRALEEISSPGQFATMLLARIDLESREMELLNAGHLSPILIPADQAKPPAPLDGPHRNPPVGALRGKDTPEYVSAKHRLEPGSKLLFYSDGITERRNGSGEMLEEEGLVRLIEDSRSLDLLPFAHHLLKKISDRSEKPLKDDATAMILSL